MITPAKEISCSGRLRVSTASHVTRRARTTKMKTLSTNNKQASLAERSTYVWVIVALNEQKGFLTYHFIHFKFTLKHLTAGLRH